MLIIIVYRFWGMGFEKAIPEACSIYFSFSMCLGSLSCWKIQPCFKFQMCSCWFEVTLKNLELIPFLHFSIHFVQCTHTISSKKPQGMILWYYFYHVKDIVKEVIKSPKLQWHVQNECIWIYNLLFITWGFKFKKILLLHLLQIFSSNAAYFIKGPQL